MAKKSKPDSLDDALRALTICIENILKLEATVSDPGRLIQRIELDTLQEVGKLEAAAAVILDRFSGDAADELAEIEHLAEDISKRFSAVFTAYCLRLKVEAEMDYSDVSSEQGLELWYQSDSLKVFDKLRAAALLQQRPRHSWSQPMNDKQIMAARKAAGLSDSRRTITRVKGHELKAGRMRYADGRDSGPVQLRDDLCSEWKIEI